MQFFLTLLLLAVYVSLSTASIQRDFETLKSEVGDKLIELDQCNTAIKELEKAFDNLTVASSTCQSIINSEEERSEKFLAALDEFSTQRRRLDDEKNKFEDDMKKSFDKLNQKVKDLQTENERLKLQLEDHLPLSLKLKNCRTCLLDSIGDSNTFKKELEKHGYDETSLDKLASLNDDIEGLNEAKEAMENLEI